MDRKANLLQVYQSKVGLEDKTRIQNSSGGNFKIVIHKKFSGRIPYCTILTINTLVNKSVNFPPLLYRNWILPARSTFAWYES